MTGWLGAAFLKWAENRRENLTSTTPVLDISQYFDQFEAQSCDQLKTFSCMAPQDGSSHEIFEFR